MEAFKKSLLASFAVQSALLIIGLVSYLLPLAYGQSTILLLAPFILGISLGPILLRPLLGGLSPETSLAIAPVVMLVTNFMVYTALFYLWFALRNKFYAGKRLPAMV